MSRVRILVFTATALLCGIVACSTTAPRVSVAQSAAQVAQPVQIAPAATLGTDGIVMINCEVGYQAENGAFVRERHEGCGFLRREDNTYYVVTVSHLFGRGEQLLYAIILVENPFGYYPVELLGYDRNCDVATFRIASRDFQPPRTLPAWSDSDIRRDDEVTVFGRGDSSQLVPSTGLVLNASSEIPREIENRPGLPSPTVRVIQYSADTAPGFSGGPVFNVNGEIIGMHWGRIRYDDGTSRAFAIPINAIREVMPRLISGN